MRDTIFASGAPPVRFQFDEQVAGVFDDMIRRSVPGYEYVVAMCGLFAGRLAQAGANCYDLGCSLGTTTLAMRSRIAVPDCRIVAVDNSAAMVERCRLKVAADANSVPVEVVEADIRDINFERNILTVSNYTLQFLAPEDRMPLLQRIWDSMLPGAALILSEKVTFEALANRELFREIYHDWKAGNGYSRLEISRKRDALENVLIPDTIDCHLRRLQSIGYRQAEVWFQSFNFVSIVAFK